MGVKLSNEYIELQSQSKISFYTFSTQISHVIISLQNFYSSTQLQKKSGFSLKKKAIKIAKQFTKVLPLDTITNFNLFIRLENNAKFSA